MDEDNHLIQSMFVDTDDDNGSELEELEEVDNQKYCKYCKKNILLKNYPRHTRTKIHKILAKQKKKKKPRLKIELIVYK